MTHEELRELRVLSDAEAPPVLGRYYAKPSLSILDVQWDGGTMSMVTTNHMVSISTGGSHVDIEIPHGNPSQQSWCYAVKAIVQRAVDDLAAKRKIP